MGMSAMIARSMFLAGLWFLCSGRRPSSDRMGLLAHPATDACCGGALRPETSVFSPALVARIPSPIFCALKR